MPNDTVRDFLYGISFGVDTASQAQAEAAVKKVEATATAAAQKGAAERAEIDAKAADERVSLAAALGRLLSLEEEKLADAREKARKTESEKDEKRKEDAAKRDRERSDEAFKRSQQQFYRMASLAVKTAAFFEIGKALDKITFGFMSKIDAAAEGFERLAYASQRVGASAGSISAFGYASAQTGSNAQAAQASLEGFGQRLRINRQGYSQILRQLGIRDIGANGQARDTGDIAAELGARLSAISKQGQFGYANALNYGRALGFEDENQVRAMMDPQFQSRYQEQKRILAQVGANQDRSAGSGQAFEQSMRRLTEIVSAVGTRINEVFFERLKPRLDDLANWIAAHGRAIGDITAKIVEGIAKVAEAFLKSDVVQSAINGLSKGLDEFAGYVASPQFKKDIKGFVADVMALAKAVRSALEWLGVIPSSTEEKAQKAGVTGQAANTIANNIGVFGNAINRGRQGLNRIGHSSQSYQDHVTDKLNAYRGAHGWWTPERQSHAVDYLMEHAGLTEDGAKALVSRWKNVESTRDGPSSANASGHRGIAQWGIDRQNGMGSSFDEQLQHAANELNGSEGKAKQYLNQFGMAAVGASIFERGEGYNPRTGRDNFTDKTDAGIAGVVHGMPSAVAGDSAEIAEARRYLSQTATGAAAQRADSIVNLNPAFALAAAKAIKQARAEGINASIFSGYRKPTQTGSNYDAQGYSGHSYGIASDFSGIGVAGSATARRFDEIARAAGLGGYGPFNPREFNHKELGVHLQHDAERLARMRATLGPDGYMHDPRATWAASGYVLPDGAKESFPEVAKAAPPPVANRTLGKYIHEGGGYAVKPQGDAVKVDVTETSAFRLGKAFVSSSPLLQTPRGSSPNTLSNIHAQWQRYADEHGMQISHPGKPARSPLGLSPHQVMQIDQSKTRGDLHLTRSDTYHLHGGDGRVMVAEARRSAGRGDADLLRNLQTMES